MVELGTQAGPPVPPESPASLHMEVLAASESRGTPKANQSQQPTRFSPLGSKAGKEQEEGDGEQDLAVLLEESATDKAD